MCERSLRCPEAEFLGLQAGIKATPGSKASHSSGRDEMHTHRSTSTTTGEGVAQLGRATDF